jgi:8-oxo-dGTP pyrophosphatase MutT (NUDIX family)
MRCSTSDFKIAVADLLGKRHRKEMICPGLTSSAILMPFYEKEGRLSLLFTKRTNRVAHHKGQVSFPGGARDPKDRDLLDTALRETSEEIGIDTASVEVLGSLDETPTIASSYVITPFVGFLNRPPAFVLNEHEVERVIELPFENLLHTGFPRLEPLIIDGQPQQVMAYCYDGHVIWGATAKVVRQFLDIIRPALGD